MAEGNTKKYLKYAIGEIILVVIGILIALQINNWNNEKSNRDKEAIILKQIHLDFKSNQKQLDSIIEGNRAKYEGLNKLINAIVELPAAQAVDTLMTYNEAILMIRTFNPSNGAVESLISSSSFELITNDSLRNLLVSWKDVYADYAEEETLLTTYQMHYLAPYLRDNFNLLDPMAEINLKNIKTLKCQNMWIDKRMITSFVLDAIEEEKIDFYIKEILRLSSISP